MNSVENVRMLVACSSRRSYTFSSSFDVFESAASAFHCTALP